MAEVRLRKCECGEKLSTLFKIQIYKDQLFLFTEKGEVCTLGATPKDVVVVTDFAPLLKENGLCDALISPDERWFLYAFAPDGTYIIEFCSNGEVNVLASLPEDKTGRLALHLPYLYCATGKTIQRISVAEVGKAGSLEEFISDTGNIISLWCNDKYLMWIRRLDNVDYIIYSSHEKAEAHTLCKMKEGPFFDGCSTQKGFCVGNSTTIYHFSASGDTWKASFKFNVPPGLIRLGDEHYYTLQTKEGTRHLYRISEVAPLVQTSSAPSLLTPNKPLLEATQSAPELRTDPIEPKSIIAPTILV